MFNQLDMERDACMLTGKQAGCGYDWWWHSFTGYSEETGKEKAFFIEFFLCNPDSGQEYPVFGQLPESKKNKIKPSYLMVKAGSWGLDAAQLHRFFGWKEIQLKMDAPFEVKAADCELDEFHTRGSACVSEENVRLHPEYMCQSGEMSWDLKIDKQIAFNVGYGAGNLFRKMQAFNMFWHAQGMKTFYDGYVMWNGVKYLVKPENCYGYADKNWGKDFTSPWVWLSSNHLVSRLSGEKLENSVFDIGGGCPKVGPIAFRRKLLSAYWHEGKAYEFNFSKLWMRVQTQFHCYETDTEIVWHVEQSTPIDRMVTDVVCQKENMLLINYEAPNGAKRHTRLWNGGDGTGVVELYHNGQLVDIVDAYHVGCEYGEYDQLGMYLRDRNQ